MNTWMSWNKTRTVGLVQNLDDSGPPWLGHRPLRGAPGESGLVTKTCYSASALYERRRAPSRLVTDVPRYKRDNYSPLFQQMVSLSGQASQQCHPSVPLGLQHFTQSPSS
jgi:hypothetical protein